MSAWPRHPLHPALAHFPLAFWLGGTAADLIGLRTGQVSWWSVSHIAIAAGTLCGAVTLIAGLLELILRRAAPGVIVWLVAHASLMSSALVLFMVSLSWRTSVPPPPAAVALSLAGSALVLAGGFCGGTLVYGFGMGVSWREEGKPGR